MKRGEYPFWVEGDRMTLYGQQPPRDGEIVGCFGCLGAVVVPTWLLGAPWRVGWMNWFGIALAALVGGLVLDGIRTQFTKVRGRDVILDRATGEIIHRSRRLRGWRDRREPLAPLEAVHYHIHRWSWGIRYEVYLPLTPQYRVLDTEVDSHAANVAAGISEFLGVPVKIHDDADPDAAARADA